MGICGWGCGEGIGVKGDDVEDVEAADADEKKSSSDDGGGGVSDGRLTAMAGGSGSSISTG